MNKYGTIAQRHWMRWCPARYAAITDPGEFFAGLGDEASSAITALWAQMRTRTGNPPGEDFLARTGRLAAQRKQAEEIVLAEMILLPPEPGTGADDAASGS